MTKEQIISDINSGKYDKLNRSWSDLDRSYKNDKEVVLTVCKYIEQKTPGLNEGLKKLNISTPFEVFASKEIQELCKDKDPIKVLESAILAEKLQATLSNKQNQTPTKKLKI